MVVAVIPRVVTKYVDVNVIVTRWVTRYNTHYIRVTEPVTMEVLIRVQTLFITRFHTRYVRAPVVIPVNITKFHKVTKYVTRIVTGVVGAPSEQNPHMRAVGGEEHFANITGTAPPGLPPANKVHPAPGSHLVTYGGEATPSTTPPSPREQQEIEEHRIRVVTPTGTPLPGQISTQGNIPVGTSTPPTWQEEKELVQTPQEQGSQQGQEQVGPRYPWQQPQLPPEMRAVF